MTNIADIHRTPPTTLGDVEAALELVGFVSDTYWHNSAHVSGPTARYSHKSSSPVRRQVTFEVSTAGHYTAYDSGETDDHDCRALSMSNAAERILVIDAHGEQAACFTAAHPDTARAFIFHAATMAAGTMF